MNFKIREPKFMIYHIKEYCLTVTVKHFKTDTKILVHQEVETDLSTHLT